MKKLENKTGMPVNLIIDELKSDDIRKRIHSVKNINLIASTIGPERTKSELVPFLQELLDDEDEVLTELVDSLSGSFLEYLGGPQNQVIIIPLLEALCKVEEPNVREKSANQLKKIFLQSNGDQKKQEEIIMGLLRRLQDNDYYMSKSSLAILIPAVISNLSSNSQAELISSYQKMVSDPIPSIRKYASINFKEMVKLYPLVTEAIITATLTSFMKDEQDFIRMYVVDSVVTLSKTQLHVKNNQISVNMYKQLAEDVSWRVRYYFCDKLVEVAQSCGKEQYRKIFQPYHLKFLQDPEPEMKSIACLKIEGLSDQMDAEEINTKLIPLLKTIQMDTNSFVRNSMATSLLSLAPVIGKKGTSEQILPIFLTLLKDTDSDVRITLFKKLNLITKVLGVESLSQSVIPALTELAQDKNWRIRAQTIEVLSFFAKAIGAEFLNDKVIKLLMDWLADRVFAVREVAIVSVRQLIEILGAPWAEKNLLNKVLAFQTFPNYLQRLTVLFTITAIAPLLTQDCLNKVMLPVLQNLAKDPVANVRLNVCKTIQLSGQIWKERELVKKVVQGLSEDADQDVKYMSKSAIEAL